MIRKNVIEMEKYKISFIDFGINIVNKGRLPGGKYLFSKNVRIFFSKF
jgi:hypothetical protein